MFPLGDGRFSSGSPMKAPSPDADPYYAHAGERVWVFRGGEWNERVLTKWSGGYAYVVPVHDLAAQPTPTLPHFMAEHMPRDCGAQVPPQGLAGIQWWLAHDPTVFANVYGVSALFPRPAVLWE